MASKECIACAEMILAKASLCRYCGTSQIAIEGERPNSELSNSDNNSDEVSRGSSQPSWTSPARRRAQRWRQLSGEMTSGQDVHRGPTSCPICQLSDRVEKVSAVVSGGRSNSSSIAIGNVVGTSRVGIASAFSSSQSELSNRLYPPAPKPEQDWVMGPLGMTIIATIFVRNVMLGEVTSSDAVASVGLWGMSFIYAVIPGVLLGLLLSWFGNTRLKKASKHQSDLSSWRAKSDAILRMYYCFRDDVVFDAQTQPQTPEQYYSRW